MKVPNYLFDFLELLLLKKRAVLLGFILAVIFSWFYAFIYLDKEYLSSITFFPPLQSGSVSGALKGFGLNINEDMNIAPEQIVTIMDSKALRSQLIERFDLIRRYKFETSKNKHVMALKKLDENVKISIGETGSMGFSSIISYSIDVYDRSSDTCYEMVDYYFYLIDSTVKKLGQDGAHRERVFVEKQVGISQSKLDSIQKMFQEFQISNKAYNVPSQISVAVSSVAQLKSTIIANNIKIHSLEANLGNQFSGIVELKQQNKSLRRSINKLVKKTTPDVIPGLEFSTKLLSKYTSFLIEIETNTSVVSLLKQQLIQSRLKEKKDVSTLHIIDTPRIPEYKSKPKRIFVILTILILYFVLVVVVILTSEIYKTVLLKSEQFARVLDAAKKI